MKKGFFALLFTCAASALFAVPYASQIRVSSTSVGEGAGLTITYELNEAGDSTAVEIKDGSSNTVATFAGTAAQGENTVVWDGTSDNAGGSNVGAGTYRVQITADKNAAAGWTEFASNRSVGLYGPATTQATIFDGFSGHDFVITHDTDLDAFGHILVTSAYGTVNHAAAINLNPDLSVSAGDDGFASRLLKALRDVSGTAGNQDVWGAGFDPDDPNGVFVAGQAGAGVDPGQTGMHYGNPLLEEVMDDADPSDIAAPIFPRSVALQKEGTQKFAYIAGGTGAVNKVEVDALNQISGTMNNILNLATTNLYSKDVEFDDSGNLYWASRGEGTSGVNGRIFRWNSADIQGNPPSTLLSESNAAWDITVGANMVHLLGVTIDRNGNVYTAFASGTERGLYLVGNVATATLTKTLTTADRVVDFTTIDTGWILSGFGANVDADYAGNVYVVARNNEQVRGFSPGGNTSVAVTAPTSQTFAVTSGVSDWSIY